MAFPLSPTDNFRLPKPGRAVRTGSWVNTQTVVSALGAVAQVITITATGPANATVYSGLLSTTAGVFSFSVTTDGSATAAELAAAIQAQLAGNADIGLATSSVTVAGGVVTVNMLVGQTGTVTYTANPGTVLATAGSAATAPPSYYFGRVVDVTGISDFDTGAIVINETAAYVTGASSQRNFRLVLDDGFDVSFGTGLGGVPAALGPVPGCELLVAQAGPKNWYSTDVVLLEPATFGAVWVETAAGANNGRLYTANTSGTCIAWTEARFVASNAQDAFTIIEL